MDERVERDTMGGAALDQRLYGLQDGNWNVTCLADMSGSAVQRYVYSAYGVLTVDALRAATIREFEDAWGPDWIGHIDGLP